MRPPVPRRPHHRVLAATAAATLVLGGLAVIASFAAQAAPVGAGTCSSRTRTTTTAPDTRLPYLRDFDIYAGHDWASAHGAFASGDGGAYGRTPHHDPPRAAGRTATGSADA
ncbi:hypothetical protein HCA58_18645 [Micromonospora sp. HNM0581]|uniref:hypothetical protein n=1 Tax=Micromonospora sp. HNM0581 TaxID=2716341 RepID=UPI00146DDAEA|nr:hypothetical protein [Micromonospora sp. HNM0581]NLU80357.1 hypothetical protein [Micromonospora sp. HNM0581]